MSVYVNPLDSKGQCVLWAEDREVLAKFINRCPMSAPVLPHGYLYFASLDVERRFTAIAHGAVPVNQAMADKMWARIAKRGMTRDGK